MQHIQNLKKKDVFDEDDNMFDDKPSPKKEVSKATSKKVIDNKKVHIGIYKRTGKNVVTTLTELNPAFDFVALLRQFKKDFSCNGFIKTEELSDEDIRRGIVPQQSINLNGDHREVLQKFLIKEEISKKEDIVMHGW